MSSDVGLEPYTEYQYAVVAVNAAGSTTSSYSVARTAEVLPEGLRPPKARVNEGETDRIYLSWSPPEQPNGKAVEIYL